MVKYFLKFFSCSLFLYFLSGCGGGSSGTEIGGSGDMRILSGVVVSKDGKSVPAAQINLLNTTDSTTTDEAGVFEIATLYRGVESVLEVTDSSGKKARVNVTVQNQDQQNVELSILFDARGENAQLLALTLRARIVGNCGLFFLNTRTIRQTSAITEGLSCLIEADFRRDGLPADGIIFHLQHRGCSPDDPWQFTSTGTSGTSGPGVGELPFRFKNDERHCVYRIVGPLNTDNAVPLSAHIHTLRKQRFDKDNR